MNETTKKAMRSILPLAFVLFPGSGIGAERNGGLSPANAGAGPSKSEEVIVTLKAPLGSPFFSETPVAIVDDEPITLGELAESIAKTHAGRVEEATEVKKNYAKLLERIINRRLIVLEARNMGLDELPEIAAQVDTFSTRRLISSLMKEQLRKVEPDPAEVDALYKKMSREFLLSTLRFGNEKDATAFAEQCKSGDHFDALAERFIEAGRAERESGGRQYLKLKDLFPRVAEAAFDTEVGSVSEIFASSGGFLIFHIKDARFYEDPELEKEARQRIVQPLMREKAYEYGEFLERKYATIDEELFEQVDFEVEKTGALWFRQEKPVDYRRLLDDERVLATVHGDEPSTITVGDLARELQKTYFHGVDKALDKRNELNEKKWIVFKNILLEKTAQLEAHAQGLDQREEYLNAVEEHTNSLIFEAFVKKVIAPDIEITEGEVRRYYQEHPDELSSPKMLRMNSLVFAALPDAERALKKLRDGADFKWVSANSPGQIDKDAKEIGAFEDQLLSVTGLPDDLQEEAGAANQGDYLLYSDSENRHHVIAVEKVFPPRQEAYETARSKIAEIIFQEKARGLIEDWSTKLKKAYETRIFVTGLGD